MAERIESYLETAGRQIRWKRAQPMLLGELRTHLLDQKDACAAAGMDDDAAEAEALRQMGDPVMVGAELDRVHRPVPQKGPLALTAALVALGACLRVWVTSGWGHASISPGKTAVALLLGFAALAACYLLDFSVLGRHARQLYGGAILCAVALIVLSPMVNNVPYYARYVCLLFPTVYACWLFSCRRRGWLGFAGAVLGLLPLAAVNLLVPYTTGLLLLLAVGAVLLAVAAWQDWFGLGRRRTLAVLAALLLVLTVILVWAIAVTGYGQARLTLLLHPELEPLGGGYQAIMLRRSLRGARLLGVGTLEAPAAAGGEYAYYQLIPESQNDCFLATLIHSLGWVPSLLLLACFALLLLWMIIRCLRQRNLLGRMVALSVVLSLGLQALLSILLNLGFVLVSAHFPLLIGNLHLVLDLALVGLALSVFRGEKLPGDTAWPENRPSSQRLPRVSVREGALIIRFKQPDSLST